MSLADAIMAAAEAAESSRYDDLGLIPPAPDPATDEIPVLALAHYLVARTLKKQHDANPKSQYSNQRLHTKDGVIYQGNERVEETAYNLYKLSGYDGRISRPLQVRYWVVLKDHIPHLNTDYFQVDDYTFWDKKNGEIITTEELERRIEEGEL